MGAATLRGEKNLSHYEIEGFMETSHFSDGHVAFMTALYDSIHSYVSDRYDGRVVLYQAITEPLYHLLEMDRHWLKIASGVEMVPIRGTHETIVLHSYVRAVADHLRGVLGRYRRDPVPEVGREHVIG